MIIYLVSAFGGQYEDSWQTPVRASTTYKAAQNFINRCEKADQKWIDKANRIIAEFMDKNPRVVDIIIAMDYVSCGHHIDRVELWS